VWSGRKSDSPTAKAGAALGVSAASLPLRRAVRAPGSGSPPGQGSPGARPALEGAELWPPVRGHPRGSVNAMTSPLGSAAQQEMLSASPLPARRKWGSFFPAAAAPAETYFRGRLLRVGEGGRRGGECTCFAMAHFTDFARGLHGAEKTGMLGDRWPWGVHITCTIEGTPSQVGQKL